jgi:hypothetical protein
MDDFCVVTEVTSSKKVNHVAARPGQCIKASTGPLRTAAAFVVDENGAFRT